MSQAEELPPPLFDLPPEPVTVASLRMVVRTVALDFLVHGQPELQHRWKPGAPRILQVHGDLDLDAYAANLAAHVTDVVMRKGIAPESFESL